MLKEYYDTVKFANWRDRRYRQCLLEEVSPQRKDISGVLFFCNIPRAEMHWGNIVSPWPCRYTAAIFSDADISWWLSSHDTFQMRVRGHFLNIVENIDLFRLIGDDDIALEGIDVKILDGRRKGNWRCLSEGPEKD